MKIWFSVHWAEMLLEPFIHLCLHRCCILLPVMLMRSLLSFLSLEVSTNGSPVQNNDAIGGFCWVAAADSTLISGFLTRHENDMGKCLDNWAGCNATIPDLALNPKGNNPFDVRRDYSLLGQVRKVLRWSDGMWSEDCWHFTWSGFESLHVSVFKRIR